MANKSIVKRETLREGKIKSYSERICLAWNKALESIFDVGDLILEARDELSRSEYLTLINQLPFGPRAAQALAKIAACGRLRKKGIQKLLPPHWGTLVELERLSPKEFERALKQKLITPAITREEVQSFRILLRGGKGKSNDTHSSTIVFEIPDGLNSPKTLLDLQFIIYLTSTVLNASPSRTKIGIKPNFKLSAKASKSYKIYEQLIEHIRQIENHFRKKKQKAHLNELQSVLSLLGANPDNLGNNGFCLFERLALAYMRRQGLDCLDEKQLKWFTAKRDAEPELLGSFLEHVENQVATILSKKSSKLPETKIYEIDDDAERKIDKDGVSARR